MESSEVVEIEESGAVVTEAAAETSPEGIESSSDEVTTDVVVEASCAEESEGDAEVVGESTQGTAESAEPAIPQRSEEESVAMLEALLLAHGDPLAVSKIQEVMGVTRSQLAPTVEKLSELYQAGRHGVEIVRVGEKLQLRTKPAFAEQIRQLMAVKPKKLSNAALETLSVIAYQQPIVKSELEKIRGVDVTPTLKTLLERKLVKILGYQATVGQPALYGTTEDFLQVFGLSALSDLPSIRDLKALAREPGEAGGDSEEAPIEEGEVSEEAGESAAAV